MKGNVVYLDQWVRARPFLNKAFLPNGGECEANIKEPDRVRCTKCFDAEKSHWDDEARDRRMKRRRAMSPDHPIVSGFK